MSTHTFTVTGMTCGHCVASVTEEVEEIPGVTAVAVDLGTGRLEVTSGDQLDHAATAAAVLAAVTEAGFALAEDA